MLSIFKGLFGHKKAEKLPFYKSKAYHYLREGVIAGGGFKLKFDPPDVVEYYSYPKPVPEYEGGMKDKGADIYFVGLKEGKVEVTAVFKYPTCEDEEYTFTLKVAEDLTVTKSD